MTSIDKKSISFGILQNAMSITIKSTKEVGLKVVWEVIGNVVFFCACE